MERFSFNLDLDIVSLILVSVLAFFLTVQLVYYWIFLAKPYYYQKKVKKGIISQSNSQPPVSIIICAKNEAQNLQKVLPSILEQDYPEYEVVVVNDNSTDDSEDVLKRLKAQYSHLYHTYIPQGTKNLSRKKLGITLGVKATKYDALLFTEIDSRPISKKWVANMARHFSEKKTIVLGFCAFGKQKGFLPKFASFDYFFSNLQMMSMALFKQPYGANGRNLAYLKKHFDSQKGYSKHRFLQIGEDDLFVNEVATKRNIAIELSPESIIKTRRDGLSEWKDFKINKAITKRFYKRAPVLLWRLELVSRLFFAASFIACFIYGFWNIILPVSALLAFIIRFFSQMFVINKTAGYLKLEKFYFTIPLFDLMQPFVNTYFYMYRLFKGKKNYTWNIKG